MIIDFRARPPVAPFTMDPIYEKPGAVALAYGIEAPPSAVAKSMDLFLAEMEESGVVHCVCTGRALPDPRLSVSNDDMVKVAADYPGKFSIFAAVDPYDVARAVSEVERAVTVLGCRGIIMEPNIHLGVAMVTAPMKAAGHMFPPLYPDDARFYPIFEKCQELGTPVMLTLSARTGPDITYSSPVYVDRIAGDFPRLKIVISHACWPWVNQICGVAWKRDNVYLLPDVYLVHMPAYLQFVEAANSYLKERLLFGTSFPVMPIRQTVEAVRKLPFREEVMEKVFYGNAARLLGL